MRVIRHDDLISLAYGATFFGTGGGGTLSSTLEMIDAWADETTEVPLHSVDEACLDTAGLTVVSSFIGSQAANELLTDIGPAITAVKAMDRWTQLHLGSPVKRTIPVELGVQSSAVPSVLVAGRLGLGVVDADGAGRAVPVLPATLYAAAGLSAAPTMLTNAGNCTVIVEDENSEVVNLVAGGIVSSPPFSAVAGMCLWPMANDSLARTFPPTGSTRGSLSLCLDVGAALRMGDIEAALGRIGREDLDSAVLFRGRVAAKKSTSSADHQIVTFANDAGARVTTYSVSENLVLWDTDSGHPLLLAPDSLCYVTPNGKPVSNTELPEVGEELILIAIEARRALVTSPIIRKSFSGYLEKVGFPGPYRPFRELRAVASRPSR